MSIKGFSSGLCVFSRDIDFLHAHFLQNISPQMFSLFENLKKIMPVSHTLRAAVQSESPACLL